MPPRVATVNGTGIEVLFGHQHPTQQPGGIDLEKAGHVRVSSGELRTARSSAGSRPLWFLGLWSLVTTYSLSCLFPACMATHIYSQITEDRWH